MKIINTGAVYEIYSDNLKVFDRLPPKTYSINCSQMTGFYLTEHSDMEIKEKVYGARETKADKVLRSFASFNRNLGVILSGNKGIGKSLFAKMLCIKAQEQGYPVLIVERFIPGIAQYIASIDQEVLVLFDEFDKTFRNIKTGENEADPQAGLLSLFDGISNGKKLFVVTCNELYNINDYMVNRPGRFHYHFRFEYPSDTEIREYLSDILQPEYHSQIENVISFANRVSINYDCLRAIAFELNSGESFERAIKDLNIVNLENERYNLTLRFSDGTTLTRKRYAMDLFSSTSEEIEMYDHHGDNIVDIEFDTNDAVYDYKIGQTIVDGDNISFTYYGESEESQRLKTLKPLSLSITRHYDRGIHYAL